MTAKQFYENVLIELNKFKAPSLMLNDYIHYINKAVNQYVNKNYSLYELSQQKTDDLRVLSAVASINPLSDNSYSDGIMSDTVAINLPDDYLHILNCIIEYKYKKKSGCNEANDLEAIHAIKTTSNQLGELNRNYYFKPKWNRPYFYLTNVITDSGDSLIKINTVDKVGGLRYGNSSKVRCELKLGKLTTSIPVTLNKVYIDYVRSPQWIDLTEEQLDDIVDHSQILEFQDYICYELVNECVHLIMEQASDQRLQSHIPINTSIASPGQSQK